MGYPLFFLFCFVLFAYLTFPYERVKDFIVQEVEYPEGPDGKRRASGRQLEIVDLSPSWFTGAELTGVRISSPEEPEGAPTEMSFEHVYARVSLWPLLSGETEVSFDTRVAGGDIEGTFAQGEGFVDLDASFSSVHLRRIGPIRAKLGIPIFGRLDGDIACTSRARPPTPRASSTSPSRTSPSATATPSSSSRAWATA